VQAVLKKALAYDGLARGLHEAARAIERDEAKVFPCRLSRQMQLALLIPSAASIIEPCSRKVIPRWYDDVPDDPRSAPWLGLVAYFCSTAVAAALGVFWRYMPRVRCRLSCAQ